MLKIRLILASFVSVFLLSCSGDKQNNEQAIADSIAKVREADSIAQLSQAQNTATTPSTQPDMSKPLIADLATGAIKELITKAALVDALKETGPFTLFVPSTEALQAAQAQLKGADAAKLKTILSKHIVKGLYAVPDLMDGQELETLSGEKLKVKINAGVITINGAEFVSMDEMAQNGVIHQINQVLK